MPLETGNFVNDLDQSNPPGGDDRSQGDNHIRLIKSVLKNSFPGASKAFRFPVSAATATTTVNVTFPDDQNKVFPVDATSGEITVNLPNPASGSTVHEDGFAVTVVKVDSSANAVVLQASGVQTINGNNAPHLSSQWAVAHLVWCKTAAQWVAITPNILSFLYLTGFMQSINSDNTAAEEPHLLFQRGTGAGDNVEFITIGDTTNGVAQLLMDIGGERVLQWLKTFVQVGKSFFVGTIGSAAPWGVLSTGYMQLKNLASPVAPAADHTYLYSKGNQLTLMNSSGVETTFSGSGAASAARVVFTSSGTWTKNANLVFVDVHVVGGGGDATSGDGGTSSFGAHCEATGGAADAGTPGSGSGGDVNLTGERGQPYNVGGGDAARGGAAPGMFGGVGSVSTLATGDQAGNNYGGGGADSGSVQAGSAGGASMKRIAAGSLGATVAVTVGAGGGGGSNGGAPGIVVVDEYYFG